MVEIGGPDIGGPDIVVCSAAVAVVLVRYRLKASKIIETPTQCE